MTFPAGPITYKRTQKFNMMTNGATNAFYPLLLIHNFTFSSLSKKFSWEREHFFKGTQPVHCPCHQIHKITVLYSFAQINWHQWLNARLSTCQQIWQMYYAVMLSLKQWKLGGSELFSCHISSGSTRTVFYGSKQWQTTGRYLGLKRQDFFQTASKHLNISFQSMFNNYQELHHIMQTTKVLVVEINKKLIHTRRA